MNPTLYLAALAPLIWGSTYIVTATLLPPGFPLTLGLLRALPAGLLLLALNPVLPSRGWLIRLGILGGLNFAVFWAALFVAAYRLPGGRRVAATAPSGTFDGRARSAALDGPVQVATSDGYEVHTGPMTADMGAGTLNADGPIEARAPFGELTAGGMEAGTSSGQLRFTGGVRLVYTPPPDATYASPEEPPE